MNSISEISILVVEDDAALLKIMTTMLLRKGFIVHEASDGHLATFVLAKHKVDLVLSDVQMPVMDGLELLEKIRAANPALPVVLFVTGQADVDEQDCIQLGASGLLRKPVRSAALFAEIEKLLGTLNGKQPA